MNEAVTTFLTAVSAALSQRGEERLSDYVALAATLIHEGEAAREEFRALASQVQGMVDANRDPTPDEWAAVKVRRDELSAAVQAAGDESAASAPRP